MTSFESRRLLCLDTHEDTLDAARLSASSAKLAVLRETRVADVLKMCHINYIEASSRSAGKTNGESFQPSGLTARTDELSRIDEGHISDTLQVSHILHAQPGNRRIKLQLETLQTSGLPSGSGELAFVDSNVSNPLKMNEHIHSKTCSVIPRRSN